MQLPVSQQVNTASLARIFDNKSESYKLFWFKAILHQVGQGEDEITFRTLIERMIVDAWYMVSEYRLNLGPSDTLEKTVKYIAEQEKFRPTESEDVLLSYLRTGGDRQLRTNMRKLSLNVPYRLQAPLMERPDGRLWSRPAEIIDYINMQTGMIYTIYREGALDSRIRIAPEWMDYFRSNLGILLGWTDYNLIIYLQRRNPTVPGIANKIYPPQERNLTRVTKYWKHIVQNLEVADIYTGDRMTAKDLSIDHFVPWSYVASDELWNLVPTTRSVNSSKSNNLPRWEKYFDRLVQTEFQAYRLLATDKTAEMLFNQCAKENLNTEEIRYDLYRPGQTLEHFAGQLEEIMLPVYDSAKNMGFREWIYER